MLRHHKCRCSEEGATFMIYIIVIVPVRSLKLSYVEYIHFRRLMSGKWCIVVWTKTGSPRWCTHMSIFREMPVCMVLSWDRIFQIINTHKKKKGGGGMSRGQTVFASLRCDVKRSRNANVRSHQLAIKHGLETARSMGFTPG